MNTTEEYLKTYHAKMREAKNFEEVEVIANEAVEEVNKDDDDYSSSERSLMLDIHRNHPMNLSKVKHNDLFELWKTQSKGEGGAFNTSLKKHLRIKKREQENAEKA